MDAVKQAIADAFDALGDDLLGEAVTLSLDGKSEAAEAVQVVANGLKGRANDLAADLGGPLTRAADSVPRSSG